MSSLIQNKERRQRCRREAMRTWGIYFLALASCVVVVVLLAFLGALFCASIIWQPGPLYSLLQWVADYLPLVCAACVLIGWSIISYYFIAKPVENMELFLAGAEELADPDEKPIRLPPGLKNAEDQLNLVREQALRANRAARDAEQRKNDLVVYLAHDLKTPLTSVIGYLTLLRDEPELSPALRARYTGIALEKAQRLEELVNEFFDITRFNLSHLELSMQTVNLSRMLEQVTFEFEPVLADKSMTWRRQLEPGVEFLCDPDKLERVFDNLFRNAVNYGYAGSEISISLADRGGTIVIHVENRGKTIPPEQLGRIFEQFFRLDSSRGTSSGGAGLGLAIAKEIVELHGGTICAESADERIAFTVTFPRGSQKIV